jgi:hypothetical protein
LVRRTGAEADPAVASRTAQGLDLVGQLIGLT